MSTRINNIRALLERSNQDLSKIEEEYNKSLHAKSIDPNLKIDIKNYCENLRSVLDYLARDIRDKYCPSAKSNDRFYFPILPDGNQFSNQTQKWFPDLHKSCQDLYSFLESIQPYQSEKTKWIGLFNKLNNENKHGDLVEQIRTESKQVKVDFQGGSVSWNPSAVKFGSGVYIGGVPVNPNTQMPIPHPSQKVEIITWIDFKFQGINVSALWLLKESYAGIDNIATTIQEWL